MRIDDAIFDCVGFLGYRNADEKLIIGGTAFFVYWNGSRLAVTVKHVISMIRHEAPDNRAVLWLNTDEGPRILATDVDLWRSHETDESVDVAVLVEPLPNEPFVLRAIRPEMFVTEELLERLDIGAGDELYFPGLFVHHKGHTRLRPILRRGTIAAMPGDPVMSGLGPTHAYLGELRSIGGMSGSPVFLHVDLWRVSPNMSDEDIEFHGQLAARDSLLGLMHGHFPYDGDSLGNPETLNTGIGVIIPINRVIEVLSQEGVQTLVAERRNRDNQLEYDIADADSASVAEAQSRNDTSPSCSDDGPC